MGLKLTGNFKLLGFSLIQNYCTSKRMYICSLLNEFSFPVKSSVSQPIWSLSFAGFFSKRAVRWMFLLYKHQCSGLCFQPGWGLCTQPSPAQSRKFTSENSHFPLHLIHPQFTSNNYISSHFKTCWNEYKFSRWGIQGPIVWSCLGEQRGVVAAALSHSSHTSALLPAAHQTRSVLPAEPSFSPLKSFNQPSELLHVGEHLHSACFPHNNRGWHQLFAQGGHWASLPLSLLSGKLSNLLSWQMAPNEAGSQMGLQMQFLNHEDKKLKGVF